jgi:hypothetical protein
MANLILQQLYLWHLLHSFIEVWIRFEIVVEKHLLIHSSTLTLVMLASKSASRVSSAVSCSLHSCCDQIEHLNFDVRPTGL